MAEVAVLKVEQIQESAKALRTEVDRKNPQYIELLNSIKQYGLIDAIAVRKAVDDDGVALFTPHGDPQYVLINGLQRKTCHQDLGMKEIPCNIMTLEEANALAVMIAANSIRVDTTKSQFAQALKQQLQMGSKTLTQLAIENGKSEEWVTGMLSLNKLPEEARKLMDNGTINVTNAIALARLPGELIAEHIHAAQIETAATFAPKIEQLVKEHRAALREGRKMNTGFQPVAVCRKPGEFKAVYAELQTKGVSQELAPVIEGKTNPIEIAKAIFDWLLHLDPISIAAAKAKFEADEAAKKEKAEKKAAEKARKEQEAAANTAGIEPNAAPVTVAA